MILSVTTSILIKPTLIIITVLNCLSQLGNSAKSPLSEGSILSSLRNSSGIDRKHAGNCFKDFAYLKKRFTFEQLDLFCQQKQKFDEIIFGKGDKLAATFTRKQRDYIQSLITNTAPSKLFIRKEIRALNETERLSYVQAMVQLQRNKIDNQSKFDILSALHHPTLAPGSHIGPAFLPWHREFLRIYEEALYREQNDFIGLPYWDSSLDAVLPQPLDSILWMPKLMSNIKGVLMTSTGKRKFTDIFSDIKSTNLDKWKVVKRIGGETGYLFDQKLEDYVLNRPNYSSLTACIDSTFEIRSRQLHQWVGGTMDNIYYASHDALFYLHHSNVGRLWDRFMKTKPPAQQRYPRNLDCCSPFHYGDEEMKPFGPATNREIFNRNYINSWRYEEIGITQCVTSPFLFYYDLLDKCVSKVKRGGDCSSFKNNVENPCYRGRCVDGICTLPNEALKKLRESSKIDPLISKSV